MRLSKFIVIFFLLFPWRIPLWSFASSEAVYAVFILIFTLTIRREKAISRLIFPVFILLFSSFLIQQYFDVALLIRLFIPLALIPVVSKITLGQEELRFLAWFSLIFVFLNYFELAKPIVDPYKGRTSSGLLSYQYYRASGLHIYPSDFAFFCILLVVRLKDAFLLKLLLVLAVILSASRAGLAFILLYFFMRNLTYSLIVAILSFPFLKSVIDFSPYLALTLESIINGSVDGSIQHRFGEWDYVIQVLTGQLPPILKNYDLIGLDIIEGFYSYYIINFGYPGILFIAFLIFYYLFALKVTRYDRTDKFFVIILLLGWFLASDILNHTKNLFFGYLLIYSHNAVHYEQNQRRHKICS